MSNLEEELVFLIPGERTAISLIQQCMLFYEKHGVYSNLNYRNFTVLPDNSVLLEQEDVVNLKYDNQPVNEHIVDLAQRISKFRIKRELWTELLFKSTNLDNFYKRCYHSCSVKITLTTFNELLSKKRCFETILAPNMLIGSGTFGSVYGFELSGKKLAAKITKTDELAEYETLQAVKGKSYFIQCLLHAEVSSIQAPYETTHLYLFNQIGNSLHSMIHRLTPDQQIEILIQLSTGLKTLHELKIIHGDIKPENVLVDMLGDSDEIKEVVFIDFGSSYHLDSDLLYSPQGTYPCTELNALEKDSLGNIVEPYQKEILTLNDWFGIWVIVDAMVKREQSFISTMPDNSNTIQPNQVYINFLKEYRRSVNLTHAEEERCHSSVIQVWKSGVGRTN